MEVEETAPTAGKMPTINAKGLIHKKYGREACYTVEEVRQSGDNACPGFVIPENSRTLYRCCLALPDLSVTSDTFTRKKDAEQSAALLAVEKLGIQSTSKELTPEEACNELVARISILFSDELLSSSHPLVGHLRMALGRVGELHSRIPLFVVVACDVKCKSLCKIIDPRADLDPLCVPSLVWSAAKKSESVCTSTDGGFWLWKKGSYSSEALQLLLNQPLASMNPTHVEATFIPCSIEEPVETITLDISSDQYYMNAIAQKLDSSDASQIFLSRPVGKSSSEMKLYFATPKISPVASEDLLSNIAQNACLDQIVVNKRASYLSGQNIYGDAILANIGYRWKSSDLYYEDVTKVTYYRMILGKRPDGHYKMLREAILAAELPTAFTSRSNWKGPLPKELLCVFCRQHRLPEPLFSVKNIDSSQTQITEAHKKLKPIMVAGESESAKSTHQNLDDPSTFQCEVKILSRMQDIILECSSENTYKKESDAVQNVALKVLTWLNKYFKQLDIPIDSLASFGLAHNIIIYPLNFSREFATLVSLYGAKGNDYFKQCTPLESTNQDNGVILVNVEGEDSGVFPSPGCLTCVKYSVMLRRLGDLMNELIESKDEFEFEVGTGAVINQLESCATQLSVNQTAQFIVALPSRDLLLAAAGGSTEKLSKLSLSNCFLEISLKVLRVAEPLEDRMEQALFSPALSKQRVEFAVKHINDSCSTTLVDFGCGSGSLLDSLLEQPVMLEKIAGVDISRKGLTRAAKIIHSKLIKNSILQERIRSAVLYDGSITKFDSRLYGFDIGTCLEVIEHMQEDQASLFGDVVLSSFRPRLLIVSTPNYEYNPILQNASSASKEEDMDEKSTTCRFRNFDHKFEWTRRQFEQWATDLSVRHNYSVEFSGVGGSGDVEPGFASQIAVFKSNKVEKISRNAEPSSHPYEVIWEWNNNSRMSS